MRGLHSHGVELASRVPKKVFMSKLLKSQQREVFLGMLRDRRQALGSAQVDLAHKLGQTQARVSRVERGARRLDLIELRGWLRGLDLDFLTFMTTLDAQLQAAPANDFDFLSGPPSAECS